MAVQNAVYEKVGLPPVTGDEQEDATGTILAIGDPESLSSSVLANPPPPPGNPEKALENVFYINFNPDKETQSPQLKASLDAVKANVDLNSSFLSAKASVAVNAKVQSKELKDDEVLKANYKAKVVNYVASSSPWTAGFAIQALQKSFSVEKNKFHETLVSTFTQGLELPATINTKLEGTLNNIKNTINVANDDASKVKENIMFFILMTYYKKDDVLQAWQAQLRTIYFRVDQSLSKYTLKKGDTSSGVNVDVKIDYVQTDGSFNNALFEQSAKPGITVFINNQTGLIINNPLDVPV